MRASGKVSVSRARCSYARASVLRHWNITSSLSFSCGPSPRAAAVTVVHPRMQALCALRVCSAPGVRRTRNHPVAIPFVPSHESSTPVARRDIPDSDSGAARALGLWRCLFNPERRLWRARIPTISGFCCRSRTETHEALPADRLGVGVRVLRPQQQAPMLFPKLHAPHADSAHVQPPVIIPFIA
ncbi:hypothetical protein B0H14DRAFT_1568262 [Mycena olivaceomarginata]|nr:hypothetical protein B0H14DRAFT_1568262 [Mycena olivaceomarginata]